MFMLNPRWRNVTTTSFKRFTRFASTESHVEPPTLINLTFIDEEVFLSNFLFIFFISFCISIITSIN